MKPAQRVYLVGGGACTSIGATLPAAAAAVRAGISLFGDHAYMVDSVSNPFVVAQAACVPDEFEGAMRMLVMAAAAADEAIEPVARAGSSAGQVQVIVGLPAARPGLAAGWTDEFAERLRRHLATRVPVGALETLACGHAAGVIAMGAAWSRLRSGAASLYLVGGTESYLHADTLEWLESCDQVHSAGPRNNAWGFVPGEGAGFSLFASEDAVKSLGLVPWAELHSVAIAREPNLIKTETVCLGHGLTEAFEQVFAASGQQFMPIDDTICDLNGEPYRSDEFGFASLRTAQRFVDASRFDAPADCWGDVGAASGPLFANLAATARRKGYSASKRTLIWTSSESGERAAAVLGFDSLPSNGAA